MTRSRSPLAVRADRRRKGAAVTVVGAVLLLSLALVARRPTYAPGAALIDGLLIGGVLGAVGLIRSYDDSWDEFRDATILAYVFGVFALAIYALRREPPSAFFVVQCAAGVVANVMLFFVPLTTWLGTDLLLYVGTFAGWLISGVFRPGYD